MIIRTMISLLFCTALSLHADPECAESLQTHEQLLTIYRSVPELQPLTGKSAFFPMEYRVIAPGYYLLCADIGSGAHVYHFALVRHHEADDTWMLIAENKISSSAPRKYIHHEVKGQQYQVEILLHPNKWVNVFSGTLPEMKSTPLPETDSAEQEEYGAQECGDSAQDYKAWMIAWVEYYKQLLVLARGVHDKDSADAAALLWEKAYIEFHQKPEIGCFFSPTEEEDSATLAEVSATHGNLHVLEKELEAERSRLKKAYYFHSEHLARAMDGDPVYAYPCIPATPDVAQSFADYYKASLAALTGAENLHGGPGFSTETAWRITTTQENEAAIKKHITRKGKLNFQVVFAETKDFRFILSASGRKGKEDDSSLFHLYTVVPNGDTTAYQLKQYFRMEKGHLKSLPSNLRQSF